jgi:DNA replication regulator DPB11
VKLRPAEPGATAAALRARETQTAGWAQDSEGEDGDASTMDTCPRPFKGVVLCATGIADKVRGRVRHIIRLH